MAVLSNIEGRTEWSSILAEVTPAIFFSMSLIISNAQAGFLRAYYRNLACILSV